jgi:nucleotide-binding universal stress UspA family protein
MRDQGDAPAIRRILVAIDASHHSLAALEAAAELAAALKARLEGIFVEDVRLLRIASHPMASEVQYPFAATASLNPARMRRELRAQATQARRALDSICRARKIEWSFRVQRGDVVRTLLRAAQDADLLSLGVASRPLTRRVRMGSTAQAAAARGQGPVLFSQRGSRITSPIMAVYDGSPAAKQALGVALVLAGQSKHSLTVVLVASGPKAATRMRREVAGQLRGMHPFARYHILADAEALTLAAAVHAEQGGMLVLGGTPTPPEDLQSLLNAVACPVLVIR